MSAQDPVKLAPQNYKVLFENDRIRVIEYRLKPGEKEPMHSHPYGVFVYFLSDAKIRTTFPDGKTSEDFKKAGDTVWRDPVTHAGKNIGDKEAHALLMEPKSSPPGTSAKAQPAYGTEEEVRRLQDALIDAYIHRDIAALDRMLADEYTFTNDDGTVVNKRQTLDSFKSGDRQITSYKRDHEQVQVYGDIAVMRYRYQSKETYKSRDDSSDDLLTRIFVRRDGRWQAVAGQETRVSRSRPSDE